MTFLELINDFGSTINQTDGSGDFVSSFVTTTEAKRWLNQSYQEVYKWYALANRGRFSTTGYADTVGGRAIYLFGGDAVDLLALESVGIRYSESDVEYRRVEKKNKADAYDTGFEKWGKTKPIYFERQIKNTATDKYQLSIEFPEACIPDESVEKGLQILYIERPPKMVEDEDEPQKLPDELHQYIVLGASVKGFRKMGEFEKAESMTGWFDRAITSLLAQEQSLSSERTKRIKMPKRDVSNFYRYDR